jgi:NIMA-interacting peptidyl-prolyl cis-trans isomerase 4
MKYSEDKAKEGGNLGWKRRDELNGVFAEAAFKLAKGKARA